MYKYIVLGIIVLAVSIYQNKKNLFKYYINATSKPINYAKYNEL